MDETYAEHSTTQATGNKLAQSFLSQVVQRTLTAGPVRVFAVADYGSSVGNNSVVELADVVRAVAAQKGSEDLPVTVTHVDQPGNDWTALFHTAATKQDGYMFSRNPSNVFHFAASGNMYEACFPPVSMSLVYSGYTFHWMSRSVKAPDHIWAARSQDSSTLKQHADQAHDDLRTLLTLRAAELQPGGCLVATFVGSVEEDSLVSTDPQWRLFDIVNACWMELERNGEISATERSSLALGVCLRNVQSVEGVLDELNHLYTVHHLSVDIVSAAGDSEDTPIARVLAQAVQPFLAIFGPQLRQVLDRKSVQEQNRIMDLFKSALCTACIEEGGNFNTTVVTLSLQRKQ